MVEQFCKSILQLEIQNSKSLANLVMGLSSESNLPSAVSISLSSCYHYQYSSISKTVKKTRVDKDQSSVLTPLELEKKFAFESGLF